MSGHRARIVIITGKGRGKTSNAVGRIYAHLFEGKKIIVIQFMKTSINCGECKFITQNFEVPWFYAGKRGFIRKEEDKEGYKQLIQKTLEKAMDIVRTEGSIDVLLLDELGMALSLGLISWNEVIPIINFTNEEVIITGRLVPSALIQKADIIIKIKEVKHPYQRNILARKGVDY